MSNCNFSVQNIQYSQGTCNNNILWQIINIFAQLLTGNGFFYISQVIKSILKS